MKYFQLQQSGSNSIIVVEMMSVMHDVQHSGQMIHCYFLPT